MNANPSPSEYTVPAQINGIDVILKRDFQVSSPSTGKGLYLCSSASPEDAIIAVSAAQAAYTLWRFTLPGARRDILLRAAAAMESRAQELGQYMIDETGSSSFWAQDFNIPLAADILRDVAGRVSNIVGMVPTTNEVGRSSIVLKEPYGVIMAVAPWNAPYILGVRSIAYAIAAGNTAILKGSELSPRCFWAIGDIFRQAGLPPGVLNVIIHKPSDAAAVTRAVIQDPRVKKINFTGSTSVGRIISELAGRHLKPVLLELGGKAPAVVWKDADLELAAEECAKGAFLHSGQVCMATERIVVHRDVFERFHNILAAATHKLFPKAKVLINKASVVKNKWLVEDALSKGARVLYGDFDSKSSVDMGPIILEGVKDGMGIYHTETFGPVVFLIAIDTEEEALRIANDTEYGLTSAVFTEDLRTGLRFAKGIEAGACHINSMTVHDESSLPHGGMKGSGYGRFGSIGLDEWLVTKTVTYKD
ncbi:hypothetical protein VE01_04443 [Pseudogymnoascus verrucosus]|uniref:Aldehyde dehydrogenase domain-containing protein n=1 Tax=Pseudogymnoascus verrucosus TaxID=342668 RepID=A0A1B8GP15_9PEZI|nr:uncharacterized protein VE01_04443 [Pseudogymnoascus verrucosus]OBT97552.1 hypothetical protein VE01_04443 [Pseudogymnoascus verrucosus]